MPLRDGCARPVGQGRDAGCLSDDERHASELTENAWGTSPLNPTDDPALEEPPSQPPRRGPTDEPSDFELVERAEGLVLELLAESGPTETSDPALRLQVQDAALDPQIVGIAVLRLLRSGAARLTDTYAVTL